MGADAEGFRLHPRLEADTHLLLRTAEMAVLLHRNASVPWFIIVPTGSHTEFLELPDDVRHRLMEASQGLAHVLREVFSVTKINFAAIGNEVPQLHLHVVGRRTDDPCWPRPVWGHLTANAAYDAGAVEALRARVQARLGGGPH